MKVSDILKQKGETVFNVAKTEQIESFAGQLKSMRVGAMVVLDNGELVGIISERDIVNGIAEHGRNCLSMTVGDLMTTGVVTCLASDNIAQISRLMTEKRIRHLPVVEDRKMVGIISVGDVVKNRMEEMSLEANVLRDLAIAGH